MSTSTIKVIRELKTFILGTLPMLLTVMDFNSRKTFINLSKCLCYYSNIATCTILVFVHVAAITVRVTKRGKGSAIASYVSSKDAHVKV